MSTLENQNALVLEVVVDHVLVVPRQTHMPLLQLAKNPFLVVLGHP